MSMPLFASLAVTATNRGSRTEEHRHTGRQSPPAPTPRNAAERRSTTARPTDG